MEIIILILLKEKKVKNKKCVVKTFLYFAAYCIVTLSFVFCFSYNLKMAYIIKCCNCYIDIYLLEINQRPKTMNLERSNLLNIIRIKDIRTEWKSKDGILKQWFLIDCEIVFHICFVFTKHFRFGDTEKPH